MDALKSTALVPGEPEYKSEYNLLNILLYKIPKHVDLIRILKAKPLQPRHCLALQELHLELFPIRYDPKFFEIACSTESGFFDSKSFWDFFDFKQSNLRDSDWSDNQFMSIGLFLPRSYVSFFRKTGEYEIEKYLKYLVEDDEYTEFDDPLTQMLVYDFEYDEFLVGFVTLLINMDVSNNLISDDDYNILNSFFKNQLLPAIYSGCVTVDKDKSEEREKKVDNKDNITTNLNESNKEKEDKEQNQDDLSDNINNTTTDNNTNINNNDNDTGNTKVDNKDNSITNLDKSNITSDKKFKKDNKVSENKKIRYVQYDKDNKNIVERVKKCIRLNENLFNDSLYSFLYNQLYTNELLLEYVSKFTTKSAKSLYILSTGITLGLRSRSLGTNLILFLQVLIYFMNHGFYIFQDKYYRLFDPNLNLNKSNRNYYSNYTDCNEVDRWELRDNFDSYRNILNLIKNYYNNKIFDSGNIYTYYNYVLNSNYVPYNCDKIIKSYFENKKYELKLGEFCTKGGFSTSDKGYLQDTILPTSSDNGSLLGTNPSGVIFSSSCSNNNPYKSDTEVNDSSNEANEPSFPSNEPRNNASTFRPPNELRNDPNVPKDSNVSTQHNVFTQSPEFTFSKDPVDSNISTYPNEFSNDIIGYTQPTDSNVSTVDKELIELLDEEMPVVMYLHTIYYNELATRVYENLNFYHIATIPDYYLINDKKYDARVLAYYMYL